MAKRNLYVVYNEGTSPVCITTKDVGYCIEGGQSIPLSMEELIYLNGTTPVFRVGMLFFDKDEEEAVYDELKIHDWKNIMHNSDIEDLLLHPTYDGLMKIINITINAYFERIRGVYTGLVNSGVSINNKVSAVIQERFKEFRNGKIKSAIILSKNEQVGTADPAEVEEMREQNAALLKQMSDLHDQMQKLLSGAATVGTAKPAAKKKTTATKSAADAKPTEEVSANQASGATVKPSTAKKTTPKKES